MRIVFMGTPEFAVPSLEKLHRSEHDVVAVITAPDRPAGRGKKVQTSPVGQWSKEHGIPLLQPLKLKATDFLEELRSFQADLQVVVAFRMLPEVVWGMPPQGTINLHGSLLPNYRGAAPIHWAVINGEQETGVTTFFLDREIDTGRVIQRATMPIASDDTTGDVHDRMMHFGAGVLLETVESIAQGTAVAVEQADLQQPDHPIRHAPKIQKSDARIDWTRPAEEVRNFIRGMNPFPGAWTKVSGKVLKVHRAEVIEGNLRPGEVSSDGASFLAVGTGSTPLQLNRIQLEGKRPMDTEELLRGTDTSGWSQL